MRVQKDFPNPSRTKQSFTKVCDINQIMKTYNKTGNIAHVNRAQPVYADFSSAESYMDSLNALNAAQEMFDALPSALRARCDNDPAQLIAFVEDEANWEEIEEAGWFGPKRTAKEPKPKENIAPEADIKTEPEDSGQSD